MKKLIYIFILFSFVGFSQSPLVLASIQQATPSCTPDANEIHTESNAASDPNCNESNATTGWINASAGSLTSVSDTDTGLYAIKHTATSGGINNIARYSFAVVSGETFTVVVRVKRGTGAFVRMTNWTNVSGGPSNVVPGTSYSEYTYNLTATATGTANLNFYSSSNSSGEAGSEIFISTMSVIKTS